MFGEDVKAVMMHPQVNRLFFIFFPRASKLQIIRNLTQIIHKLVEETLAELVEFLKSKECIQNQCEKKHADCNSSPEFRNESKVDSKCYQSSFLFGVCLERAEKQNDAPTI